MSLTYADVCEALSQLDEVTLIEVLQLKSEDIVARCQDLIEENIDELMYKLGDDTEEQE